MLPKYEISVEDGDIDVNMVMAIAVYENALSFDIDCKQKYPESGIVLESEDGHTTIGVYFSVGEDTLYEKDEDAPGDDDDPALVTITIQGEWDAGLRTSKYGARLHLIRKTQRDENWVGWYRGT